MKLRSQLIIIAVIVILTLPFIVDGQVSDKSIKSKDIIKKKDELHYDTSRTTIIMLSSKNRWAFDTSYKQGFLTQAELNSVDSILVACVTNYNNKRDRNYYHKIDLSNLNYRKQLIVLVNMEGKKEIYVNCFCKIDDDSWKTEYFRVYDGGNCFFNFKINVAERQYFDLQVN
jgi:hypothetical protein